MNTERIPEPRYVGNGICEITLSNGMVALIDDGDAETIGRYKWHASTTKRSKTHYAKARITHPQVGSFMHRVILCFPLLTVDHINGNGLDNRRCNLRFCTHQQNSLNVRNRLCPKTSRFRGVYFCKTTKKWCAQIRHNMKLITIGSFNDELSAAIAWDERALQLRGDFAILNFSTQSDVCDFKIS
jgi:hypothetical protein